MKKLIYKPSKTSTMHALSVNRELFKAICNGQRSCLIVQENDELLTNAEMTIVEVGDEEKGEEVHSIVVSINHIETAKNETGLKKDYALISVSVVRHIF